MTLKLLTSLMSLNLPSWRNSITDITTVTATRDRAMVIMALMALPLCPEERENA